MTQELPLELYRWLSTHQVVDSGRPTFRPNGKCEIESNVAHELSNGIRVAKLVIVIAAEKGIDADFSALVSLKNSSTPASKLYNWNLLNEVYRKLYRLCKKLGSV
jgi:hypothetical protein